MFQIDNATDVKVAASIFHTFQYFIALIIDKLFVYLM
jgi:hypothetical protein